MKRTFRIFINIIPLILGFFVLFFGVHLAYNALTRNVHTVISGKIYRSAQFNHKEWVYYSKKLKLKSVIDLRGSWPSNHWYQVESAFTKQNHLDYYPIQFSAYQLPTKNKLRELVNLLETAPKPIIFHCEGGADRTGMAAAISIILFDKDPSVHLIKKQASWHYNAISRRTVGYQMLKNYFAWLKQNHDKYSSKKLFLEWVNSSAKMRPYYGWFWV